MLRFSFPALTLFLVFNACKQVDPPPPTCIDEKIEAFKQLEWADKIVKVNNPSGTLYWFVDSVVDGGEQVLNEQCELVCVADCECAGDNIVFCDGTHLDFPMETIWEK